MMPDTFHLIFCDLICDDRQALIELHSITIDNLSIEFSRYFDSELPIVVNMLVTKDIQ
jgi:hypothetical protein